MKATQSAIQVDPCIVKGYYEKVRNLRHRMSDQTRWIILFDASKRPATCHYILPRSISVCSSQRKQPVFGKGDRSALKVLMRQQVRQAWQLRQLAQRLGLAPLEQQEFLVKEIRQGRIFGQEYSPATSVFAVSATGSVAGTGAAVSVAAGRTRIVSVSKKW